MIDPISFEPVPMETFRPMVGPKIDPACSPMVDHGAMDVPLPTSATPSMTTWPWGK